MAIIINNDHWYNILEHLNYSSKKSRFSIYFNRTNCFTIAERWQHSFSFLFLFSLFIKQSLYVSSRNIAWYVNFLLIEVMTTTRNWIFLIAPVDLVHNVNEWSTQHTINLLFSSVQTNEYVDWWSYLTVAHFIHTLVYYRLSSNDKILSITNYIYTYSRINNIKNHLVVLIFVSTSLSFWYTLLFV